MCAPFLKGTKVDDTEQQKPDLFRHAAFLAAVLLLLGAWKFGLEGLGE